MQKVELEGTRDPNPILSRCIHLSITIIACVVKVRLGQVKISILLNASITTTRPFGTWYNWLKKIIFQTEWSSLSPLDEFYA